MEEKQTAARPFLKWSGGKTQLLPELLKRVPENYDRYFEPFVGGGALFFALKPRVAWLGDANAELINAYEVIRSQVDDLISVLRTFKNTEEEFYMLRAMPFQDRVRAAARMIYLNKTCFNGLYRVNKKGQFNAPYGKYANPTICDEPNLRACSAALREAYLAVEGFTEVENRVRPGDFVYFDPPYIPLTKTSSFTAYTPGGFGMSQQLQLRDMAARMKDRGVHVLISNSGSPITEEIYSTGGFTLEAVAARRNINSKGAGRGAIKEFLIR